MGYATDNVLPSRFLLYMRHNVAEKADPIEGIQPIRVNSSKKKAEDAIYNESDQLPAPETVHQYIKACFDLFKFQKADSNNKVMFDHPQTTLRSPGVKALMHEHKLRFCEKLTSMDSASLNVESGYEMPTLKAVMWDGWSID